MTMDSVARTTSHVSQDDVDASDNETAAGTCGAGSARSSLSALIVQYGRRYQNLLPGEYWGPADDTQFESMRSGHVVQALLDSHHHQQNPLFRSPIGDDARRIIDLGTGAGDWAVDVADQYPSIQVLGLDLYVPPRPLTPANCTLELGDVLMPWMTEGKSDLVHLRGLLGSFTTRQWKAVYMQAWEHLKPGGWIEHLEPSLVNECDDGTMPPDSKQAQWGPMFYECARVWGKPLDIFDTMKESITAAGFTNVHEHIYKIPIGEWPNNRMYKEVGHVNLNQITTGLEGYAMLLLRSHGLPEPWSPQAVAIFLDGMREELMDSRRHTYIRCRRVWAQKQLEA